MMKNEGSITWDKLIKGNDKGCQSGSNLKVASQEIQWKAMTTSEVMEIRWNYMR